MQQIEGVAKADAVQLEGGLALNKEELHKAASAMTAEPRRKSDSFLYRTQVESCRPSVSSAGICIWPRPGMLQ